MTKMNRNLNKLLALAMIFCFVSSCATVTLNAKTPKQQATIWMDIYNAQYNDTMAVMSNPSSTETQKAIGRKKKEVLIQIWPLLKAYADTANNDGVPSDALTAELTSLINRLTSMATGGH